MKIYFGKADPKEFNELFEHNGAYFMYELEVNPEDESFKIQDTCGRYVPFDLSDVVPLVNALSYVRDYTKAKSMAQDYVDGVLNKLSRMYGLESREF